jgi:hypothetical protein
MAKIALTTRPGEYLVDGEIIIRSRQRREDGTVPVLVVLDTCLENGTPEQQRYDAREVTLSTALLDAIDAEVAAQLAGVPAEIVASREAKLAPAVKEPVEQEIKK